jgi:fermentation-respiration switch protein FrsA (DUF1100 family)
MLRSHVILILPTNLMKCCHVFLLFPFVLLLAACSPLVNMLAFHPNTQDVMLENDLPENVKEVKIKTQDDVTLLSLFLRNDQSKKLVIYFHGNAGNIYGRLRDLKYLHESGCNVLGMSYRGYGKSQGKPSESGIYLDGKAGLKYAQEELGFEKKNIYIFGRSIGSTVAVEISQLEEFGGVILVTPLSSAQDQAQAGGMSFIAPLAGDAFNNVSKIKEMQSPLLLLHGMKDRVIPFEMGKKVFDAANVKKQFVRIKGAGHNNIQYYRTEYWTPIIEFLKET